MKLADWLKANDVNFAEFGRRIERSAQAVRRYANDERIPDRDTMPAIVRETDGAVTANDFYPIDFPLSATVCATTETTSAAISGEPSAPAADEPELPIEGSHAEPMLPMEQAA